jgi:hypothetical protein
MTSMTDLASRTALRALAGTLALAGVAAGCSDLDPGSVAVEERAIYGGQTVSSEAAQTVLIRGPGSTCSGAIYSKYWVLTAAHCIAASSDPNADGTVTVAEGAADYTIDGVLDGTGVARTLAAWVIYKHPFGTFGSIGTVDAALIFMSPSSSGANTALAPSSDFTNDSLNLYQGSITALINQTVASYGYGQRTFGGPLGLRVGSKRITGRLGNSYTAAALGTQGTNCWGDGGGKDMMFDSSTFKWVTTGIHATQEDGCTGAGDLESSSISWRDWVVSTAATCPAQTRTGHCHF